MYRNVHTVLLAGLLLLTSPLLSAAEASHTVVSKLSNGMQLIVREDHRAPVAVVQVWYRIGAFNEHIGITGVSHFLEHMLFKGTKKYPDGQFSKIITANGGQFNAFTGQDATAYYEILAVDKLPISFKLEADRMRNVQWKKAEFDKEKQVVMEERRLRYDDVPRNLAYERLMATTYMTSPYRHPVVGWMNDLKQMRMATLQNWYHRWYTPNNAVLVVVGDVKASSVRDLAEKTFGRVAPQQVSREEPTPEVPAFGGRKITLHLPTKVPALYMAYHAPVLKTAAKAWQPYAVEALSAILSAGNSARFARQLVREQKVAVGANAYYDAVQQRDGLLVLSAVPAEGVSIARLEEALRQQIKRLQNEPIGERELARVKAQVMADKIYAKDSLSGQAMSLGRLAVVDLPWQLADTFEQRLQQVTAAQVQQVARQIFTEDNLTIAVLLPQQQQKEPAHVS